MSEYPKVLFEDDVALMLGVTVKEVRYLSGHHHIIRLDDDKPMMFSETSG